MYVVQLVHAVGAVEQVVVALSDIEVLWILLEEENLNVRIFLQFSVIT
jgi:hypothetical protein